MDGTKLKDVKARRISIAYGKVPEVTGKTRAQSKEIRKNQRASFRGRQKVQRRMKDIVNDGERIQRVGKRHGATTGPAEGRWEINGGKIEGIKRGGKKGSTYRRGRVTGAKESREGIII